MLLDRSFLLEENLAFPLALEAAPTLSALFAGQRVEQLASGGALVWHGDRATHVFEVKSGVLRVVHEINDGRRVIARFLFAGDLLGVGVRGCYPYTVEAAVPSKVRRLSWPRFESGIEDAPALHDQFLEQLRTEVSETQNQVVLLSRRSAEERLCGFLLAMARRTTASRVPGTTIGLPMSRLDIADYLGVTIETVSRTMTRLREQGVVSQIGRFAVVVNRPDRLAELAGDVELSTSSRVASGSTE